MIQRPPVYKMAAGLLVIIPVAVLWLPLALPMIWHLGRELFDDRIQLRIRLFDTSVGVLWAAFGVLGVIGLAIWVVLPLQSRTSRIVTGAFIILGMVAAAPLVVGSARELFWPGLLLGAACLLGLGILLSLLRSRSDVR